MREDAQETSSKLDLLLGLYYLASYPEPIACALRSADSGARLPSVSSPALLLTSYVTLESGLTSQHSLHL